MFNYCFNYPGTHNFVWCECGKIQILSFAKLMIRAVFFHGLESSLPSSKVVVMQEMGWEVSCRQMDYNQFNEYRMAEEFVLDTKPNLLVGSSLGGALCSL